MPQPRPYARKCVRECSRDSVDTGISVTGVQSSACVASLSRRSPSASVNFVTAHDGFTLLDVVSYVERHNEANGENNRDGHAHNYSSNYGVEGPTDDAEIVALRRRQRYADWKSAWNNSRCAHLSRVSSMICRWNNRNAINTGSVLL